MRILLLSTYELGHQPFGLASPAAWLRQAGAEVVCLDLAVQPLAEEQVAAADVVAFYVPMHTATRLAVPVARRVRRINPRAHLCFYGLYAPVNADFLRLLGARTILGGEFEEGLVALVRRLSTEGEASLDAPQPEPEISLARQRFVTPDRAGLAGLDKYAYLTMPDGQIRTVAYTEASRGCKHTCRHCPIVPVYEGAFRVVQRDVVLADVEQQVAAGAGHVTFGDPDFFNGPGHALPLVKDLHERWPHLTYDVTIKVEHLLKHARELPVLRETGCVLVTSAVEAVDDAILEILDKRHTRADVFRAVALLREAGIALNPTFVTFTPWTTPAGYLDLLAVLSDLGLVESVAPIQYAIRLLIPAGSKLLDLPRTRELVGPFDAAALSYPWVHSDPAVDRLYQEVLEIVTTGQAEEATRGAIFERVWQAARAALGAGAPDMPVGVGAIGRARGTPIPRLSEPWFC